MSYWIPAIGDLRHSRVNQVHLGCLPFSQKIRKFRLKVKWNSNFPENSFENCGLPPEVLLFFRSEWNVGNFLAICTISQFQSLINGKQ